MDWANVHVEDEKVAFLSSYNLNHTHLDNQEAITGIRSSHDKMVQATGDDYKTEKALIKEEIETIQKIAEKIFIGLRCDCVEILADDAFEYGEVAATVNYSKRECYIILNSAKHIDNPAELEGILRHEYSHILHEDNFHHELIQCMAWTHSQDSNEEVIEKSLSFCRALETRADVYAAVNSVDHGTHYIAVLKKIAKDVTADHEATTHPKISERIALLEKIKSELTAEDVSL